MDGMFTSLDDVPMSALTLTIPTLMSAKAISCVVPGRIKQSAVRMMLWDEIGPRCPASILRTHSHAALFLDLEAFEGTLDNAID